MKIEFNGKLWDVYQDRDKRTHIVISEMDIGFLEHEEFYNWFNRQIKIKMEKKNERKKKFLFF